jgi:hypothetical protein
LTVIVSELTAFSRHTLKPSQHAVIFILVRLKRNFTLRSGIVTRSGQYNIFFDFVSAVGPPIPKDTSATRRWTPCP